MTELFKESAKVDVRLEGFGESVTVPEGKVWVVTVAGLGDRGSLAFDTTETDDRLISSDTDGTDSSISKVTIHGGRSLKSIQDEGVLITGWQFEYSGE